MTPAWVGLGVGALGVAVGLLGIVRSRRTARQALDDQHGYRSAIRTLLRERDVLRQRASRRLAALRRVAAACRAWQNAAADAHRELAGTNQPTDEAIHLVLWTGEMPTETCELAKSLTTDTPAEEDR